MSAIDPGYTGGNHPGDLDPPRWIPLQPMIEAANAVHAELARTARALLPGAEVGFSSGIRNYRLLAGMLKASCFNYEVEAGRIQSGSTHRHRPSVFISPSREHLQRCRDFPHTPLHNRSPSRTSQKYAIPNGDSKGIDHYTSRGGEDGRKEKQDYKISDLLA
ncbi:hypothetical protein Bbelb_056160 [Branchiostoma belcheri]|nr:hypothetical protein Bbelb_056160 [Branchiostoma belcheri]